MHKTEAGEPCSEDGDKIEPEAMPKVVGHLGDNDHVERGVHAGSPYSTPSPQ